MLEVNIFPVIAATLADQTAALAVVCRPAAMLDNGSSLMDSESDSYDCSSDLTDRTFAVQEGNQSDRDSYSTTLSTTSQRQALQEELLQLGGAVPSMEMGPGPVAAWLLSNSNSLSTSGGHCCRPLTLLHQCCVKSMFSHLCGYFCVSLPVYMHCPAHVCVSQDPCTCCNFV